MWLQSSDVSPTVWGELGNQEFLQGMGEWKMLLVLNDSSPTEDMGRGRKDHHHFCSWHKSTQGRCAGVLPAPKTFALCPSSVCMSWTLGPAALGELWGVLCPRGGTAALGSAQPGHQRLLCAALGTCPLLQQQLGLQEGRAGGFSKENSQTREPCGNKHRALHFH